MYCVKLHGNFQRGSGSLRKKSLPSFREAWLFSGTAQYHNDDNDDSDDNDDNDDVPVLSNVRLTLD